MTSEKKYGVEDASFQTAGGIEGIQKLVEEFYHQMDTLPEVQRIRNLHPKDLTRSIDKLARFLCGWFGGPKRFHEEYGRISIPQFHSKFRIGPDERDAWLLCMKTALDLQPYSEDFRKYVMREIYVPAERSRNRD